MAGKFKKPHTKPNGVPSSKNPSVQRLYAELDRISDETLDPDQCPVKACKDKLIVLKRKTLQLYDSFDLLMAELAACG